MIGKMRPPTRSIIGECLGKTKWGTEDSAQRAITRLRRDYPDAFSSLVKPYRCSHCRRWHVGTSK